uniref:Double homeobox A n=1 Tax=Prolemur simus TaxID=1328070 RepID=A0A8C9A6D9_PROSS
MAQDSSASKIMAKNHRRCRTKFTDDQLKILINAFNQKPYPGYATTQRLALQINTEESRIQIWFQNRRARHRSHKKPEHEEVSESSQSHGQGHPGKENQRGEGRRCRTCYTATQLQTLIQAFIKNPYPGIECREQLAKEIGVPEARVQIWFQNRRSRFHINKQKREPDESLEQNQDKISEGVQGIEDTQNGTNLTGNPLFSEARTRW